MGDEKEEKKVDFVVVGLGNPGDANSSSRQNAGWIFIDYLANCISLQTFLMAEMSSKDIKNEEEVLKNIKDEKGVPKYVVPNFVKRSDLGALIHDTEFSISDDILEKKDDEAKLLRIILVKPIEGLMASGYPVKKIMEEYKISNPAKQLLVVREDMSNMPGSISMFDAKDSKRAHGGTDSINSVCGITEYVRFLIGIGKPTGDLSNGQFVSNAFQPANKEMDMLGYSLDLTAQALQHYAAYGDFKKTKKKYASNKKLPNKLRKMEGLVFPTTILDPLQVKELEAEKRSEEKKG
jgi:PTH1 family peptidyl-tRNA hydrolase